MGRGDGSGRVVSPEGADDSATGILHVDMDAFYASVEVLDNPSLRGKPIIVGAPEGRSVVSAASYEARRFGVRSAMPVSQALRLCPHAIVVPPHFDRYMAVSKQVMGIFHDVTPLVEPLSIDEAFLDVRGARRLWGSPGEIARGIRQRVQHEVGITCSVGIASTKHVAKMASTLCKPDGMLIVPGTETSAFLAPQPIRTLWGVGPKSAESLEARGIHTIADVLDTPRDSLERALGAAMGGRIWHLARGIDAREVSPTRVEKSVGHEETFHDDISDQAFLRAELLRLSDRVATRMRAGDWEASTISIKVRFADFTTITRSQTLAEPTAVGQRIGESAREMFAGVDLHQAVRLLGVRATALRPTGAGGVALWDDDAEWKRVDGALDDASARFGSGAVTRAAFLKKGRHLGAMPSHPLPPRPPQNES